MTVILCSDVAMLCCDVVMLGCAETLHVVEFFIVDAIPDEEAVTLIGQKPWHRKEAQGAKWKEITASSILTCELVELY